MKANWFNTLNESLQSEGLLDHWDCTWSPIAYGECRKFDFNVEGKRTHHASIYRESDGRYERPIVYVL
jgi:hypothetical protein